MTDSLLCFESAWMADAYSQLFPEQSERVLSFETLLFSLVEDERHSPSARVQLFDTFLEPHERPSAPNLLQTIESLREGLILTHEDVDYCFSLLAETPRHGRLKALFHHYLDSDLAKDWTMHVWAVIEKLKQHNAQADTAARPLSFVRGTRSRYLFSEFGRHFPGFQDLVETWTLFPANPEPLPPLFYSGNGTVPLMAFAEALLALEKRTPTETPLWVTFAGSPEETLFLELLLKRHSLSFRFFDRAPSPSTPQPFSQSECLSYVRQQAPWPTTRRLQVSKLLLNIEWSGLAGKEWRPELWQSLLDKLKENGGVAPEELAFLAEAPLARAEENVFEEPPSARVLLSPFHPLPSPQTPLGYCGKSLLTPPRDPFELTSREAESLFQKGFYVPRALEHRPRMKLFLEKFLEQPAAELYTSLSGDFLSQRPQCLPSPSESIPFAVENTRVQAPLRTLSATQLETYALCPSRYFFSNRLRLRPALTLESAYSLRFGQAVHAALEHFFSEGGETVTDPEMGAKLQALFEAALKKEMPWLTETHPYYTIFCRHFATLANKIPTLEHKLKELLGESRVKAVEQSFDLSVEGVFLTGKMDRVEAISDRAVLILDYKTGTVDFCPDHVAKGENFQALLYFLAAEKLYSSPCAGVIFYDLKKGEVKRGWLRAELLDPQTKRLTTRGHTLPTEEFDLVVQKGVEALKQSAWQIAEGHFPPISSPSTCSICDYAAYCRKASGYE